MTSRHPAWTLLRQKHPRAGIVDVEVAAEADEALVTVTLARPGLVIGRGGAGIVELSADLSTLLGQPVRLHLQEVRQTQTEPQLIADHVAQQMQSRARPWDRLSEEPGQEDVVVEVVTPTELELPALQRLCDLMVTEAERAGASAAFVAVLDAGVVVVSAGPVAGVVNNLDPSAVVAEDQVSLFGREFVCRVGVVKSVKTTA